MAVASERRATERRSSCRYPVDVPLDYWVFEGSSVVRTGHGVTLNISENGILFTPDSRLGAGLELGVLIGWPAGHGREAMALHAKGRTVRVTEDGCAVRFSTAEFH